MNSDATKGGIHNIIFKDIELIGKPGLSILPSHSMIQGYDETAKVKNIIFDNINEEYVGNAEYTGNKISTIMQPWRIKNLKISF